MNLVLVVSKSRRPSVPVFPCILIVTAGRHNKSKPRKRFYQIIFYVIQHVFVCLITYRKICKVHFWCVLLPYNQNQNNMARPIIDIIKEVDAANDIQTVNNLWNEIVLNKYSYPLSEIWAARDCIILWLVRYFVNELILKYKPKS